MWTILESREAQGGLPRVPMQVRKKYELWKAIVRVSGPQGLLAIKGFNDEALKGEWEGHRSSRLNLQWRVIYWAKGEIFNVTVERVSAHDYKR